MRAHPHLRGDVTNQDGITKFEEWFTHATPLTHSSHPPDFLYHAADMEQKHVLHAQRTPPVH